MLDHLRLEHGSYTSVVRPGGGKPPVFGQMHYTTGERLARMSFVVPTRALETPALNRVLDNLAWEAGNRGAFNLVAEVEENSPAFEVLRRAGYTVYGWQRVWEIRQPQNQIANSSMTWIPISDMDDLAVRLLYQSLVPPLVQGAEPLQGHLFTGSLYRQHDEVVAYIEATFGPRGIFLQPVFHPAADGIVALLNAYLHGLQFQLGRPVYIAVRSYQAWLESAIEQSLDARPVCRQALMVKRLAAPQRVLAYANNHNRISENRQPALVGPVHQEKHLPVPHHHRLPKEQP